MNVGKYTSKFNVGDEVNLTHDVAEEFEYEEYLDETFRVSSMEYKGHGNFSYYIENDDTDFWDVGEDEILAAETNEFEVDVKEVEVGVTTYEIYEEVEGLGVYNCRSGERVGSMLGYSFDDIDGKQFLRDLEDWLIDNEE